MEEFIQILIFVGAMVVAAVAQNTKNKKKPMTASPQEVLEDMFPDIEFQGKETDVPYTPPPTPVRKKVSKKIQPFVASTPPAAPRKESTKQEKKISLDSREKARRAFIYSEIFNRKYS